MFAGRQFSRGGVSPVVRNIGADGCCDYRPGYFPTRAASPDPATRFALVHLDCDLYEPTRAGLTFFYPQLSPGVLLIIHD